MDGLIFRQENVENLLLEAGFSDIESTEFLSFEEPNAFRTEAFLDKGCSKEIRVSIECLGYQIRNVKKPALYHLNNRKWRDR